MDLHSRRALMDSMSERYRRAAKRSKTRILDEVCAATGFHRKYAIGRINLIETCRPSKTIVHRRRKRFYGREVLKVVEEVWKEAGYPWSVRLKAILLLWLPAIRRRFSLTRATEAQLLRISPRTIDRALADKKRGLRRRLYGRTKPGTLLRRQIPIKCEHWDVKTAGHLELDTVSHCGGNGEGLFAYSFNLTDIGSTWVETRSVLGKGEVGIVKAFSEITEVLPFKVLDIDSDNGGEFINHHLYGYCHDRDIGFTRSRPYKKDDNAHIEQKNWTHVLNCPPIIGPGGVIEMACYNWHHQRERQPFKKGADDVFQPGQAVHTAVQISNRLGILKGRKSGRPTRPGVRNASDFHSSLEKGVHGERT